MSTGAAFFDLDRTLISGSSAFAFGVAAWRNDLVPDQGVASRTPPALWPSAIAARRTIRSSASGPASSVP